MLSASAEYLTYEALERGATPVVRIAFLPYYWPTGINANGATASIPEYFWFAPGCGFINETTDNEYMVPGGGYIFAIPIASDLTVGLFDTCYFIAPDRIQMLYGQYAASPWFSEIIQSNVQERLSPAVVTWNWNAPGYDMEVWWRFSSDIDDFAAPAWGWVELINGSTVEIDTYYQFSFSLVPYRAWAVDSLADADTDTAWAVDEMGVDEEEGWAAAENVIGDPFTYLEDLDLLGEFKILRDIEEAGSLSFEVPTDFSDLVASAYSGLVLNNRQGSFDGEGTWVPAPAYSPNKSSFFLSDQDWYGIQLKIELGWNKTGWFANEWMDGPWMAENFSDFVMLFLGKVISWGPVNRAVDSDGAVQPTTVEITANDWIMEALNKRIALPASDGSPNPLTYGEFLVQADQINGWSPAPIVASAYFANANYDELDGVVTSGGGAVSLVTPGIVGIRSFRTATDGANQSAYGKFSMGGVSEMFLSGTLQFTALPATMTSQNCTLLNFVNSAGVSQFALTVDDEGNLYVTGACISSPPKCDYNILEYEGVPLSFGIWMAPVTGGGCKVWINGDEIWSYYANLDSYSPSTIRLGAVTGAAAEAWTIDWEQLEVRKKYYRNAYQVLGGPFDAIGPVYINNVAQPEIKGTGAGAYSQTLTRYPELGMVEFNSPDYVGAPLPIDPDFDPGDNVMIRVIQQAGGWHPLAVIEDLLDKAGLTEYIDADSLAAAYLAVPDDIIHARYEGGGDRDRISMRDYASLGMPISEALKEICSRCLYWIFVDAGSIKIIPYTGIHPAAGDSVLSLTASNKWENSQTIDLSDVNSFVTGVYGWYDRNPSLYYIAGTPEAGGQGTGLDFSWGSPVVSESFPMVKAKVDLMLQFLSVQEVIDPVRMSLSGARVEGMDVVSLVDEIINDAAAYYWVTGKEISFDSGSMETSLTLKRFLGDT